ncbi:MAG: alpha/beta hydrolase [Proteobacteria bacterium]|nr:alpha/beta hydrolase [Pseudomonadota bacterium]
MRWWSRWLAALCGVLLVLPASAAELTGWGVVVLHGKWAPAQGGGSKGVAATAKALREAGAVVSRPSMPWAEGDTYVPYEQCIDMVAQEVAGLRAKGVRKVAVVGASIGGNVAMGYAATRRGIDAVVVIAPGHFPQRFISQTGNDLARARAAIAAGRGGEVGSYIDNNQGTTRQVHATAAGYLSFFDPDGPANFARYTGAGGIPQLWIIGNGDSIAQGAAQTSGGSIVTLNATHSELPAVAARDVVAWLKTK